jgi:hypothetical protein
MFEDTDPIGTDFVTFELNADDFELYQGDIIAPGSEIGIEIKSGSPVYLRYWGRVAAAYYNPMIHSYLVIINQMCNTRAAGIPPTTSLVIV